MNNDYYVYIYYRLDTNEPFYIGKGCKNRWKDFRKRSKHFNNIIKKFPFAVVIEKDNLTENEAFYWEEEIIRQLVFEYGFSIEILNNNSKDHYCHLVNQTWGGEGTSGINPYENKTEEERDEWCKKISDANRNCSIETRKRKSLSHMGKNYGRIGEKHHWYGKHHSEETKRKISEANKGRNFSEEHKKKIGTMRKGKKFTKETKNKMSKQRKGKNNGNAKSIICLTTKRIFFTIEDGAKFYNCHGSSIGQCCKGKLKSCGKLNGTKLVWRYLVWKHNKKYRIKIK